MKTVLTIAGHDLSSGAGITKDFDIFSALRCHPVTVPTALVIQGPEGVRNVFPIPAEPFELMLRTTQEEIVLDGIKIGVACGVDQTRIIAAFLKTKKDVPVVLDPVLSAKNGYPLLSRDGLDILIEEVFPLVDVVTPNMDEASTLTGMKVSDRETMEAAARRLKQSGIKSVVLKGGHLAGDPADLFLSAEGHVSWWERQRINRTVHGTGCMLSSLLLAYLVHGCSFVSAFEYAEKTIEKMLESSYRINGPGYFYTSLTNLTSRLPEQWVDLTK